MDGEVEVWREARVKERKDNRREGGRVKRRGRDGRRKSG